MRRSELLSLGECTSMEAKSKLFLIHRKGQECETVTQICKIILQTTLLLLLFSFLKTHICYWYKAKNFVSLKRVAFGIIKNEFQK